MNCIEIIRTGEKKNSRLDLEILCVYRLISRLIRYLTPRVNRLRNRVIRFVI